MVMGQDLGGQWQCRLLRASCAHARLSVQCHGLLCSSSAERTGKELRVGPGQFPHMVAAVSLHPLLPATATTCGRWACNSAWLLGASPACPRPSGRDPWDFLEGVRGGWMVMSWGCLDPGKVGIPALVLVLGCDYVVGVSLLPTELLLSHSPVSSWAAEAKLV